jgi:hypothetical protein
VGLGYSTLTNELISPLHGGGPVRFEDPDRLFELLHRRVVIPIKTGTLSGTSKSVVHTFARPVAQLVGAMNE